MVEQDWRAKYKRVFDACPSAAFVAGGVPLSLHYANAAFERIFGPPGHNARVGEVLPRPLADAVAELVAAVRASKAAASREIEAEGGTPARGVAWPLGPGAEGEGLEGDDDEVAVEIAMGSEALEGPEDAALRRVVELDGRLMVTSLSTQERLEEAKAAGARARVMIEAAPDAMLLLDEAGEIRLANAEAGRMLGVLPGELEGLRWEALAPDVPFARLAELADRGEQESTARPSVDASMRRPGGGLLPVEIRAGGFEADGRRLFTATMQDATARRRAELEQRERLEAERRARGAAERAQRRLTLLATASELLSTSFEARRALATLGDVVVPAHATACAFRLAEADGEEPEADVTSPEQLREALEALLDQVEASVLSASEPIVLPLEDQELGLGEAFLVAAPLRVRERALGVVLFLFEEAPGQEARTLVEELAHRAAVAVDHARLYREAWRAHEEAARFASSVARLQEVTAALSEALEPSEVAAVLADLGARAAGASAIRLHFPPEDPDAALAPEALVALCVPERASAATADEIRRALEGRTHLWLTRQREDARLVSIGLLQLAAGERVLGVLEVVLEGRLARRADLSFVESLAREGAQALHRARLYEAATRAKRVAEEASCLKDEFLGVVSHELRTPLTAILGWARLIRAKAGDASLLGRGLDVIEQNVEAQTRIVSDLLDVSRIVAGKFSFEPAPVDLGQLAQGAFDGVRHAAEAAGVELLLACEAPAPTVSGDAGRLHQVLWNLLANAIKFTPRGGRVVLVVSRTEGAARVEVEDSGLGIEPAFLPFVFDRFRQADSSTTRRHGGLGLGLAIAKSIVELHGGSIRAESAGLGRGATFRLELPLASDSVPALPPEEEGETPREARLDGIRVLVVEDEKDTLELVLAVLELAGARVREATSAESGLAALGRFRPDVLVSDIAMPGEDGLSFLRRVRALEGPLGRVPAIALTAYARPDAGRRLLQAGFQLHLPKPVQPELLALAVLRLTQASRPLLLEEAQREAGRRASRKGA